MRERGFALLIVLWTVALLAMLATEVTSAGRGEAQLARNIRNAAVTQAAADGAVAEAVFHALDSSAGHWAADGRPHRLEQPGATIELRIANEAGKLNPNTAQPELLAALLRAVGADSRTAGDVAAAITAWRFPGTPPDAYRAAGRPYAPPGAPFRSLDELGLVLGMTPPLLARLAPHLTLWHDGLPDPAAADPLVRSILPPPLPADGPAPPDERVIAVTAVATGPGGSVATRAATIRLGQSAGGALYQVLTWDAPPLGD